MKVSFDGIGEKIATFYADSSAKDGMPVKVSGNGTVSACGSSEELAGVAAFLSKDNCVSVIMGGYVVLPYSSTKPAFGWQHLVADGDGGVKTAAAAAGGRMFLVTEVNETDNTVGFFM